jgi:hydroxymethylglutaryl-CoA lyase
MLTDGLPSQVTIREVGPREGVQILQTIIPTESKLKIIQALVRSGIKEIEVASFVRPDRVPTMADVDALVAGLPRHSDVDFTALYLNQKGFLRAEGSGVLKNRGWLYTSPSESFLKANSNVSLNDSLAAVSSWIELFNQHGKVLHGLMVSAAFGCGYEGRIESAQVELVVRRFIDECRKAGADLEEVCLADTIGVANPRSVRATVRALRQLGVPTISLHLHNTWGLAAANVYAGLLEGVSLFESSVGGMGGCPFTPGASGNVATEDVVYLCHSMGITTGIDLKNLCEAAELAESLTGSILPSEVYQAWKHSGRIVPFPVEKSGGRD